MRTKKKENAPRCFQGILPRDRSFSKMKVYPKYFYYASHIVCQIVTFNSPKKKEPVYRGMFYFSFFYNIFRCSDWDKEHSAFHLYLCMFSKYRAHWNVDALHLSIPAQGLPNGEAALQHAAYPGIQPYPGVGEWPF